MAHASGDIRAAADRKRFPNNLLAIRAEAVRILCTETGSWCVHVGSALKFASGGTAALAPADEGPDLSSGSDRRAYVRVGPGDLPWLKAVRLKYGPPVSLVDLSAGGAQVESRVTLHPGSTIVVQIEGLDAELAVASQVLRCQIASLAPVATYRGALAFKSAVDFPELATTHDAQSCPPAADEHARLAFAIKRFTRALESRGRPDAAASGGVTEVGDAVLAATAMLLELPAALRSDAAFANELASLLRDLTLGVERGESSAILCDRIGRRLSRWLGASIRIADRTDPAARTPRSVHFDLPASPHRLPATLVVDFGRDMRPAEGHFHLLKATAHLVALVLDLDPPSSAALGVEAPERTAPQGACKIVVRYADGRLLKGYTSDFLATKPYLHLVPTLHAPDIARISVPIGQLKAVFFVRDFDGEPSHVEAKTFERNEAARRVVVTFLDDEVLVGTTLSYRPDADGFILFPADPKSNNLRVFVVARAVRHVQTF